MPRRQANKKSQDVRAPSGFGSALAMWARSVFEAPKHGPVVNRRKRLANAGKRLQLGPESGKCREILWFSRFSANPGQ
jgi:hypothetical protein